MTNEELLVQCKIGMGIPLSSTAFDSILMQKMLAVRGYMAGAGASIEKMDSPAGVATMVVGVADLWEVESGETKFSPVFHTLLTQLSVSSLVAPEGS